MVLRAMGTGRLNLSAYVRISEGFLGVVCLQAGNGCELHWFKLSWLMLL